MPPAPRENGGYWEQRLGRHRGLKGVGWLGLGESFNRWMYGVRGQAFGWAVREAADGRIASLDVLDVGSGTGFYLERWRRLGAASVTASDLTQVAVDRLRARHPGLIVARLDLASGDPLPLRGPYDAISAMDVLFHIVEEEGYRRALANLSSLLAPGGLLILSENLLSRSTVSGDQQVSRSLGEITEALAEAGFQALSVRPMFCLMNTPVDSSSRLLHRWWSLLARAVSAHDAVGFVVGGLLYPVELALVRLLPTGPSTKLMVCRRR
ncbi:MAG: class I SAM-dependent methyltransferase [Actinomycetota bacterium]|nr:class I SAM-dependent methyltransferase [Actinomycetota bacterium]